MTLHARTYPSALTTNGKDAPAPIRTKKPHRFALRSFRLREQSDSWMTKYTHRVYTEIVENSDDRGSSTVAISPSNSRATEPLSAIAIARSPAIEAKSLRLGPGTYRIGAAPECDLIVKDGSVSRNHLEICLVKEGISVADLGSRNGTFYLGQKVEKITLALGSRVTIGETEIEFQADREDFEGTQSAGITHYGSLSGKSAGMQRLFTLMRRLEGSLVNVLIEGESGTGKELIARAIHDRSSVNGGPFVAINCGALDRALVRSELFGHKKGAFTGALGEASGAFAEAEGGTLFLDEVGELPLDIQPVLLRVLESGTYSRIGETRPREARVRIIAATHRSLKDDVEDGRFRSDLYYRLMVVTLHAPPLRERMEDLPLLAEKLVEALKLAPLTPSVIEALSKRSYPGNVRELKHAILAYSAVGELPGAQPPLEGDKLDTALRAFLDTTRPYAEQKEALVERMTRLYLEGLIESTGGNRSEAARIAELQRGYLRRLLEKFGLS